MSTPSDSRTRARAMQTFEPHRAGIPPLIPYVREMWSRRHFAAELSRAQMRAAHSRTFFGQFWLVLNPTLSALVYYLLVFIIAGGSKGPEFFAHLLVGLFAFNFISASMSMGAASVVGGGRLVMNTAFPRLLLPLSAVRTAFLRFLPSLVIVVAFFLMRVNGVFDGWQNATGPNAPKPLHFSSVQLLAIPVFGLIILFACGLAAFMATLQVYFRDMTSFLPFFTRIWLYLSPVLWEVETAHEKIKQLLAFNPIFRLFEVWGDVIVRGTVPAAGVWLAAAAWSVGSLLVGSLFLMSREREFAVRV